eukprot:sb/3476964/
MLLDPDLPKPQGTLTSSLLCCNPPLYRGSSQIFLHSLILPTQKPVQNLTCCTCDLQQALYPTFTASISFCREGIIIWRPGPPLTYSLSVSSHTGPKARCELTLMGSTHEGST